MFLSLRSRAFALDASSSAKAFVLCSIVFVDCKVELVTDIFRKVCDISFIAGCTGTTSKYVFLKKKYSFIVKIFFSPFFSDSFKYLQYGILVAFLSFYFPSKNQELFSLLLQVLW